MQNKMFVYFIKKKKVFLTIINIIKCLINKKKN